MFFKSPERDRHNEHAIGVSGGGNAPTTKSPRNADHAHHHRAGNNEPKSPRRATDAVVRSPRSTTTDQHHLRARSMSPRRGPNSSSTTPSSPSINSNSTSAAAVAVAPQPASSGSHPNLFSSDMKNSGGNNKDSIARVASADARHRSHSDAPQQHRRGRMLSISIRFRFFIFKHDIKYRFARSTNRTFIDAFVRSATIINLIIFSPSFL